MKAAKGSLIVLGPDRLQQVVALQSLCPEVHAWTAANWHSMLAEADGSGPVRRHTLGMFTPSQELAGIVAGSALDEQGELEMLVVHPVWRQNGFGRALAERWLGWAQSSGVTEVSLEVRCSNTTAQRLYRALGFADVGRRAGYYQAPPEDALVLLKQLEPVLSDTGTPLDTTV